MSTQLDLNLKLAVCLKILTFSLSESLDKLKTDQRSLGYNLPKSMCAELDLVKIMQNNSLSVVIK